jgi:hypothetical protein
LARVYSERLYAGRNVNTDQFTVDAGYTYVVRDITVFAGAPLAGGFGQLLDHASGATLWYTPMPTGISAFFDHQGDLRLVLVEGQVVDVNYDAGLGEGVDIVLYGYKLTLP